MVIKTWEAGIETERVEEVYVISDNKRMKKEESMDEEEDK